MESFASSDSKRNGRLTGQADGKGGRRRREGLGHAEDFSRSTATTVRYQNNENMRKPLKCDQSRHEVESGQ